MRFPKPKKKQVKLVKSRPPFVTLNPLTESMEKDIGSRKSRTRITDRHRLPVNQRKRDLLNMPAAINYLLSWHSKCDQLNPPKRRHCLLFPPHGQPIKTALHDCSMTNMSSDVDPFALSVALPDQSGHLFGCSVHVGMASGCSRSRCL